MHFDDKVVQAVHSIFNILNDFDGHTRVHIIEFVDNRTRHDMYSGGAKEKPMPKAVSE